MNTRIENYTANSETTVDEFFNLLIACQNAENEISVEGIVTRFQQLGMLLRPLHPNETGLQYLNLWVKPNAPKIPSCPACTEVYTPYCPACTELWEKDLLEKTLTPSS